MANSKNEAKIKFTADTKEYNAQIKNANSTMKELRAESQLNEAQFKNTGNSAEYLNNKHKLLELQLEANKAKQEALNQKVELAKQIYGENSSEAQELSTKLIRVKTETENLTSKISQCENEMKQQAETSEKADKAFDDLGNAAKASGEKAEASSDGYTVVKDVIANLTSEAINGAVEGFKELATEGEVALDKMNAKIGAVGDAAEKYTNVAENVYKNGWGESLEDTSEAVATIVMQLGYLEEADLQKITENSMTLSDVYEFDIAESIRTVKSLMDQFGISADDAFNFIVQGAQEGLNQNGDMLDVISEYAVQFSDAGYSAENMFNMIANGYTEGSWSVDKLGDSLKEFKINMMDGTANEYLTMLGLNAEKITAEYAKGGESARTATDKVIQALIDCKDPQDQFIAGQGIMGTMWEDLGVDAVNALMQTNGELSNSKDAMEQLKTDAYDNLSASVSTLGNTFKVELFQPLVNLVSPALTDVFDKTSEIISVVSDTIQKYPALQAVLIGIATALGIVATALGISALIKGVQTALAALKTTFAALNTTMLANPIFLIVTAIAALVAGLVYAYNNCESFRNAVDKAFSFIKELFANIKTFFTETFNTISEKLTNAKYKITEVFENIKTTVSEKINTLKENITNILTAVKTFFQNVWQGIVTVVLIILSPFIDAAIYLFYKLKEGIANIVEGVKSFINSAFNVIKTYVINPINEAKNKAVEIFNNIRDKVSTVVEEIKNKVQSAFQIVYEKIYTPINNAKNKVSEVFANIKTYIENKINETKNKVQSVFNDIKEKITKPINDAKDNIRNAIDRIKGYFNIDLKFKSIKLPHFNVTYDTSGVKGEIAKTLGLEGFPKLSIDWYAKGAVFNKATILPTAYGLKGVGEAGPEAVAPISVLQDYVQDAVENANSAVEPIDYDLLGDKVARTCCAINQVLQVSDREIGRILRKVTQ